MAMRSETLHEILIRWWRRSDSRAWSYECIKVWKRWVDVGTPATTFPTLDENLSPPKSSFYELFFIFLINLLLPKLVSFFIANNFSYCAPHLFLMFLGFLLQNCHIFCEQDKKVKMLLKRIAITVENREAEGRERQDLSANLIFKIFRFILFRFHEIYFFTFFKWAF